MRSSREGGRASISDLNHVREGGGMSSSYFLYRLYGKAECDVALG